MAPDIPRAVKIRSLAENLLEALTRRIDECVQCLFRRRPSARDEWEAIEAEIWSAFEPELLSSLLGKSFRLPAEKLLFRFLKRVWTIGDARRKSMLFLSIDFCY
jgi:hypothetical protein